MKLFLKLITCLIAAFLFTHCEEEGVTSRPYPRLLTLPVSEISSEGAVFQAKILFRGSFDIQRYGFVWSEGGNPSLNNAERKIFVENVQSETFSYGISTTLREKVIYYVRSFVETDDFTVYGAIVSFSSLGSMAPQINSIIPIEGTIGDTLRIAGKNFSYLNQNNKVTFNQIKAQTVSSSDTLLRVVVPEVTEAVNKISLSIAGNSVEYKDPFQITTPVISSVSPMLVSFGDTVQISGNCFSPDPKVNRLFVGETPAVVLSASKTKLLFLVPSNLNAAVNPIRLETGGKSATFPNLALKAPKVLSVSPGLITHYNYGNVVISGDCFNPLGGKNKVRIGASYAEIVSATRKQITIRLPWPMLANKLLTLSDTFTIEVSVLEQTGILENALVINYRSTWTRMRDFPGNPRIFGASFAIGSKGYTGLGCYAEYGQWYNDFWEYNPDNDTWTRLKDFPGVARSKFATFVIGNKAYIVAGVKGNTSENANNLSEVWEFNGDTKTWTRKSDFPGGARWQPFGFSTDGKGYVGGGVYGNYERKTDFWRYTPESDSWEKLEAIDQLWQEDILGISGNKNGYILFGTCGSPCNQRYFWKYDPAAATWTHMRDMPGPFSESAGFVLNGQIYAGTGMFSDWEGVRDFFGYDPAKNEWRSIPFVEKRRGASSFAIGNYGYLLLGKSGSHEANKNDVWRFDPTLPEE